MLGKHNLCEYTNKYKRSAQFEEYHVDGQARQDALQKGPFDSRVQSLKRYESE